MAKKKIDPAAVYRVDLAKKIYDGRKAVYPGVVRLRGDVIDRELAADENTIKSYEPIAEIG